jgi:aspartyl-tRNA(Asn)/glutamyl-tRNA(Gln) amidotransferase subunit C
MAITREEILHVARLARLALSEEDVESFTRQVGDILSYMDKLKSVDTTGVPQTAHPVVAGEAFRKDEVKPSMEASEALANAPEKEDGEFIVPKII